MSLIRIDETRCKKDNLCVLDCPANILKQADKTTIPTMIPQGDKVCMRCGHCVAVCPHDALDHVDSPMANSPAIAPELTIDAAQATQFLRSRRSVRRYKDQAVPQDTIRELIENAKYAPTGGNSQLLSWTVYTDKAILKQIANLTITWMKELLAAEDGKNLPPYFAKNVAAYEAGINSITRDAPCLVIASAPGFYHNGMVDLSIALSYFELAATARGLGTCWLGLIVRALKVSKPLQSLIDLPEGHSHFYAMVLGYPQLKYHRLPERKAADIIWK